MKTFVYVDHFKGEIQPASWEAIGLGKTLGSVSAVVFGLGVDAVVKAAFEFGADEVFVKERKLADGSGKAKVTADDALFSLARFSNGTLGSFMATGRPWCSGLRREASDG